ncbi:hypothetical protein PSPO01_13521 [Paraphaeosphaeria sporulosa]
MEGDRSIERGCADVTRLPGGPYRRAGLRMRAYEGRSALPSGDGLQMRGCAGAECQGPCGLSGYNPISVGIFRWEPSLDGTSVVGSRRRGDAPARAGSQRADISGLRAEFPCSHRVKTLESRQREWPRVRLPRVDCTQSQRLGSGASTAEDRMEVCSADPAAEECPHHQTASPNRTGGTASRDRGGGRAGFVLRQEVVRRRGGVWDGGGFIGLECGELGQGAAAYHVDSRGACTAGYFASRKRRLLAWANRDVEIRRRKAVAWENQEESPNGVSGTREDLGFQPGVEGPIRHSSQAAYVTCNERERLLSVTVKVKVNSDQSLLLGISHPLLHQRNRDSYRTKTCTWLPGRVPQSHLVRPAFLPTTTRITCG